MATSIRDAALKLLDKTLNKSGYSNHLFESFVSNREDISQKDTAFLKALFFGVLRRVTLLDKFLADRCRPPYGKVPERVKIALRIGLYQIMFMDKVPPHAAVSESVELAKKYGHGGTAKLVNAILRGIVKEKPKSEEPKSIAEVAVHTSHPEWLVKKYFHNFGEDLARTILNANNEQPPLNFRVRDGIRLKNELGNTDAEILTNRFSEIGVEIKGMEPGTSNALMRDGIIAPQDQSSLIAVSLFKNAAGSVLELCCGRGNKSEALLEQIDKDANMFNADNSPVKLSQLQKLSAGKLNPICCDAFVQLPFRQKFENIFLDAPCSNLGTVRRHPELKYRKSPQEIEKVAVLQLKAIQNAAKHLAENGQLLYAVCSIEPEETTGVIDAFMKLNDRFEIVDAGGIRPDLREAGLTEESFLRIVPGQYGMDGFFAAILRKTW